MDEVRVSDDQLLAHVEHKRRNYLIGGAARTLAATALLAFGGMQAGEMVGSAIDNMDVNRLETETERINQLSGDKEEANKNLVRASQQLGEACATQLKLYLIDGQLYSDSETVNNEDQAVDDLLREPSQPCGDSATTVRQKYRQIASAKNEVIELDAQSSEDQVLISELEKKAETKHHTSWWSGLGLLVGAVGGLITGNLLARRYKNKKKDELQESMEWKRLIKGDSIYSYVPEKYKKFIDKDTWYDKYYY
jgi:ElaB/YqjD/DUF883 family membrane-anchored ribosome-binding protein